jgi:hypothetical protein
MNPRERKEVIQTIVIQNELPETSIPGLCGEGDTVVYELRIVSSDGASGPNKHPSQSTVRPRLTKDDGTPNAWWVLVGIFAPTLAVLSIITVAIVR